MFVLECNCYSNMGVLIQFKYKQFTLIHLDFNKFLEGTAICFIALWLSVWEILVADLAERGSVEGSAEFEGVLLWGSKSMLQCSIFASGDVSIAIDIFNIKNLLNRLHAGSAISLGSKNWEHTGVGRLGDSAFLDVALKTIFESNKACGKNESTEGDGG